MTGVRRKVSVFALSVVIAVMIALPFAVVMFFLGARDGLFGWLILKIIAVCSVTTLVACFNPAVEILGLFPLIAIPKRATSAMTYVAVVCTAAVLVWASVFGVSFVLFRLFECC